MSEKNHFEKFMEDFEKRDAEKRGRLKKYTQDHSESPQRKYNKLYREKWQNRIIYRKSIVSNNK